MRNAESDAKRNARNAERQKRYRERKAEAMQAEREAVRGILATDYKVESEALRQLETAIDDAVDRVALRVLVERLHSSRQISMIARRQLLDALS